MRTEALQPCVFRIVSGNDCGDSSSHVVRQLYDSFPAAFKCPRKYPYASLSADNRRVIHIDVPEKGWAHATAHGADLLRVLARNEKLSVSPQSRIVAVIHARTRTAATVFVWGEDARLSVALESLANRMDINITAFDVWFAALRAEHRQRWEGAFDNAIYVRACAQVNTLSQLASLVARQNNPAFPIKLRDALHVTLATVN